MNKCMDSLGFGTHSNPQLMEGAIQTIQGVLHLVVGLMFLFQARRRKQSKAQNKSMQRIRALNH